MNHTIQEYIEKTQMIRAEDTVIAGVSGGADSVCLLLLLEEYRHRMDFSLRVVHVEHGIRGEASREDARFVEELCDRLAVPCTLYPVDVPEYASIHHMGVEEAARVLRYQAFEKEAARVAQDQALEKEAARVVQDQASEKEAWECIRIALAHHSEDNAETILFHMIRGSGINGLCGMQPIRRTPGGYVCIRPLLPVSRKEIEGYLEKCGQEYREDATNCDVEYTRNRIRRQIFPLLEQINPQAAAHIQQSAVQLAKIQDYLAQQARFLAEEIVTEERKKLYVEIEPLSALHPALQEEILKNTLFQAAGHRKDITAVHIAALSELMERQTGRKVNLPYGVTARREYGRLVLAGSDGREGEMAVSGGEHGKQVPAGEGIVIPPHQWEAYKESQEIHSIDLSENEKLLLKVFPFSGDTGKIPKKQCTKWLDYDMIKKGLEIRHRMPGDQLCVDVQGHHKRLKQYLVDQKIPEKSRSRLWILASKSHVIWILGDRMSEDYKVSSDTSYIVEFSYVKFS